MNLRLRHGGFVMNVFPLHRIAESGKSWIAAEGGLGVFDGRVCGFYENSFGVVPLEQGCGAITR